MVRTYLRGGQKSQTVIRSHLSSSLKVFSCVVTMTWPIYLSSHGIGLVKNFFYATSVILVYVTHGDQHEVGSLIMHSAQLW